MDSKHNLSVSQMNKIFRMNTKKIFIIMAKSKRKKSEKEKKFLRSTRVKINIPTYMIRLA